MHNNKQPASNVQHSFISAYFQAQSETRQQWTIYSKRLYSYIGQERLCSLRALSKNTAGRTNPLLKKGKYLLSCTLFHFAALSKSVNTNDLEVCTLLTGYSIKLWPTIYNNPIQRGRRKSVMQRGFSSKQPQWERGDHSLECSLF